MTLLYFDGVRISTLVMVAALIVAGALGPKRRWRGVLAALSFVLVFEVAYTLLVWKLHRGYWASGWPLAPLAFAAAWASGCRLDWRALAAAVILLIAWIATGFHANIYGSQHFSALDEALNEAAKTAWGLAYLLPLLGAEHFKRRPRTPPTNRASA